MRKYTATIAQIFDLSNNQQQWLLNHLGHSMDVHRVHYRQTSGLIERIDMAKLMLMQEFNLTSKYAGKRLEDIQLNEIVFNHTVDDCDVSTQDLTEALDLDNDNVDDDFQPAMNDTGKDEFSFTDDDEDDDYDHTPKKKRSTNVSTRVRWSKEEETEIRHFFKEYFATKATPGREACENIIKQSKFLKRRSWETLKKKVWNMIKKK
ncbi:uncharacterized protein LOC126808789 [Patella vulgata]|uniref:uncharacterized protein LOC126808789 n=1 Tax=Patella vulgata TaxID=6465 RepID=UPI0024A80254|nr:uncharacterized protein LOC126808789 [Patella vulgata]